MNPDFFILYVDNPAVSVAFYTRLLGHGPLEASPTFAMFALSSGVMLGLWSKHTVQPAPVCAGGSMEVAFSLPDNAAVDAAHAAWSAKDLPCPAAPSLMHFGYSFVAFDPDGHRLRVFAPVEE